MPRPALLTAALLGLLAAPVPALAQPGEYRFAGTYAREGGVLRGAVVRVYVPWEGVNPRPEVLRCLVGPFEVAGADLTIRQTDGAVRIALTRGEVGAREEPGVETGSWDLTEAGGACSGLTGSGTYRLTDTPILRLIGTLDLPQPQGG